MTQWRELDSAYLFSSFVSFLTSFFIIIRTKLCCCVCTLRLRDMLDWAARARLVVRGNIANLQFSLFFVALHTIYLFRTLLFFYFIQTASRAPNLSGLDFHWFLRATCCFSLIFLQPCEMRNRTTNFRCRRMSHKSIRSKGDIINLIFSGVLISTLTTTRRAAHLIEKDNESLWL